MSKLSFIIVLATLVTQGLSGDKLGLHLATRGLLQTHASLSGRGIALYPAHSPGHETDDVEHLTPKINHVLYYAQEGHRPALHGAKHATFKANFTRPTVIFDHTSLLRSINCANQGRINLCLKSQGFAKAQRTWNADEFNLITYHVGCGDETSGQRSYFIARNPCFDEITGCVDLSVRAIPHEEAIHSGEIVWGTYTDPKLNKRVPVKGHVSVAMPSDEPIQAAAAPAPRSPPPSPPKLPRGHPLRPRSKTGIKTPKLPRQTNDTFDDPPPFEPGDGWMVDDWNGEVNDITISLEDLINFFNMSDFDTSDIDDILPWDMDLDFIDMESGEVWTEDEEKAGHLDKSKREMVVRRVDAILRRRRELEKRSVWNFFEGIYNGAKKLVEKAKDFIVGAAEKVASVVTTVAELAVVAAKVIAVPFGVPFDESYKNDYNFNYTVKGDASNRPPSIFGLGDGFNLAASGGVYSIQCAKCGVHGELSVEGRLAFSVDKGITEGHIALINEAPFGIDAVFGITLEQQYDKPIEALNREIASVPLSPLSIPGIITLGPQLSISGALDLVLNGKAELLIGGSLSIGTGTAQLSLVRREDNKLQGFQAELHTRGAGTSFRGSLTASVELGLPIAIEVGLDVLNGKFKKTVGFVNKPSVYGLATLNVNLPVVCQGVVLSVGVKNRIYFQAIGLWDYDLRTDILYQRMLGCVTANGFNSAQSLPDPAVLTTVPLTVGGDIANITPNISDVSARLHQNTSNNLGFRVIMDEDKSSILVSGRDGYVYLVTSGQNYDLSAPWGSVNLTSETVSLDVFGRVIAYKTDSHIRISSEIKVFEPSKVPKYWRAATPALLRTTKTDHETWNIVITYGGQSATYFPTFCKTSTGLRLYATYYMIDKNGKVRTPPAYVEALKKGMSQFGLNDIERDCRTVWLTSA